MSFGDIRQVAQRMVKEVVLGSRRTQAERGVAGRANVSLCLASSLANI